MKSFKLLVSGLAVLLVLTAAPLAVVAQDGESSEASETQKKAEEKAREEAKKLLETRREAEKKRLERLREAAKQQSEELEEAQERSDEKAKEELEKRKQEQEKLKEKFKKACENRRESYKNRLEGIAEHSQKRIEVLEKIVERVKAFKENKNLQVANYDTLLAEIAAKKLVVHDLQQAAKDLAETDFNCERDIAKEAVESFKDVLHQQIAALKEYKTAVKNLIVAVKTAATGASESGGSNEN